MTYEMIAQKRRDLASPVCHPFEYRVVGTLRHQLALEVICGGRTHYGVHCYCAALITPQDANPYDHRAVAVSIRGTPVGYLARDVVREFRQALRVGGFADVACEAMIVGGWDRGDDFGFFGVRLNARMPFRLVGGDKYWSRGRVAAAAALEMQRR